MIVLIDRSASMTEGQPGRVQGLEETIREGLARACFRERLLPDKKRALLDPARGDLLSVMAFGLDYFRGERFDPFITASEPWGMLRQPAVSTSVFANLWDRVRSTDRSRAPFFSMTWSGISLAVPLALEYQGANGGRAADAVGRTFVVLVTDRAFNSEGDPNLEINVLQDDLRADDRRTPRNLNGLPADLPGVRQRVARARMLYLFTPLGKPEERGGVYLQVFEAVPNTWAFGVESVWQFEHEAFRFRRVPGGYRSEFPLRLVRGGPMRPHRVEAVLRDGSRVVDHRVLADSSAEPEIRFSLPTTAKETDSLAIELRFWVRLQDSVYGMQLLSPDGSEIQGRTGLTRTVPVKLERAERVLGIVPLPFWAYRVAAVAFRSQVAAAWFWNVVLLLVLGVLFWRVRISRNPKSLRNESLLGAADAGQETDP